MTNNSTSYEIAPAGFVLDTREARATAQSEGWVLFSTEADAIAYGERQLSAQRIGAFGTGTDGPGT